MHLLVGLITALCCLIFFLLWKQSRQVHEIKQQEQREKIIQLLQAYPVDQYTMPHMLERSLAIMLSMPQSGFLAKGVIFLMQDGVLGFSAQRGLDIDSSTDNKQATLNDYLSRINTETDRFQSISIPTSPDTRFNLSTNVQGYYVVPLIRNGIQTGLLLLYKSGGEKTTKNTIKFIKAIGITLSILIERKQNADEINLANNILNYSHQAIFISDINNKILRCNNACERITGYSSEELIGKSPNIFNSGKQKSDFYQKLWQQVSENDFWQGEIQNKRKDGSLFTEWLTVSAIKDVDKQVKQYLAIFTDLTALKKAEEDVLQLSFFDPLTQLPNRSLFQDRVQQSIIQAERLGKQFALLCLDIDHFKNINESLGYEKGDQLLLILAERVSSVIRKEDSIARIGGDEFGILIHDLDENNAGRLVHIVEKILNCLKEVVLLNEYELIVTGSIGISLYPGDGDNTLELMKHADTAMSQAKQAGRNSYQFHTKQHNELALRKIQLESALRQALKNDDFEIHLQGQQELHTQRLVGAEALLRVKHGVLSHISPAEYIPIAEESGLIIDIGDWVFTEVCRLLRDWYDLNLFPPHFERIAVNISPVQFERHDFIRKIQQCIKETGVPVNHLEIELTECSLQASSDSVIEKLTAIQEMGINIAIDDFGTGYSSLSRLKEFPINVLKIDRSFVTDICSSQSDAAIVKAITSMSNALGIDSLAEGIETIEQANMLKKLQCQYGQGFLFSRPGNTLKFEALLSTEAAETIV